MSAPAIVSIRPAQADDAAMIFEWRNLPDIVALSEGQKTVAWEEHSTWYAASLKNKDRIMLVVTVDGADAGLVRFDREQEVSRVGLYFIDGYTGKGYGKKALRDAIEYMRRLWHVACIEAHIRTDNTSSLKFFEGMDFRHAGNSNHMSVYQRTV